MRGIFKLRHFVAAALVVGVIAGGVAVAREAHHGFAKRHVMRHINDALDAVQATAPQRDAIHAAVENVFTTIEQNRASERGNFKQVLELWQADRIDQAKLAELRNDHQAAAKRTGDAIVQAILDARDALTPEQRQKAVEFARAHKPRMNAERASFIKERVAEHIDDVLEDIHATTAQKERVHAALGNVEAAVVAQMGNHDVDLERVLGLFAAPAVDRAQVTALQAEHQARMLKLGDAIVQALSDVHDVLDAGQRKQVAEIIAEHHRHHGG